VEAVVEAEPEAVAEAEPEAEAEVPELEQSVGGFELNATLGTVVPISVVAETHPVNVTEPVAVAQAHPAEDGQAQGWEVAQHGSGIQVGRSTTVPPSTKHDAATVLSTIDPTGQGIL